ncbi:type II toxin-antitoxin system RelE/ParE family toxin [Candidatus Parcubacteria bacterium]|nr:MAG: type II toxin-antitoxin system RelE/ParE family toxin [Candidatus Parcubacteria bacterium]
MSDRFEVSYHPDVKRIDLPKIDQRNRAMIKKAIEDRLSVQPELYGRRLQRTLKDYWKLRVGQYRVVFKIVGTKINVLAIIHRKDVYQLVEKRVKTK